MEPMLDDLTTEGRNPASDRLDSLTALEIVRLMNAEDARVAEAVGQQAEAVAQAIAVITDRLGRGGRLVYMGAGSSGRLGMLDAAECPPTFSTPPEQVVGVIAGGLAAMTRAIEGAEDDARAAVADLDAIGLSGRDVLVGIATSGRTPYVLEGLKHARRVGAFAIGISCNAQSLLAAETDLAITPVVGPEVLSGSTRMKAGAATKMVLNMLSTGAMVRLGKTYGNLMVNLKATNSKLADRARRIVATLTGLNTTDAQQRLEECDGEVKTAIVAQLKGVSPEKARELLSHADGHLRMAHRPRRVTRRSPAAGRRPLDFPVARVQHIHRVNDAERMSLLAGLAGDLQQAAGVGGDRPARAPVLRMFSSLRRLSRPAISGSVRL